MVNVVQIAKAPGSVHERRDLSLLTSKYMHGHGISFFLGFFPQFSLPWELASHVESVYTPTGSSSVVSLGCSCSSAPTGRPTCPGPSALACKSFQSIFAAAACCLRTINHLLLSSPLPGRYISTVSLRFAGST